MYDNDLIIPKSELYGRIKLFQEKLEKNKIDYTVIILNADLFYFTGFVPSGILLISKDNTTLFVRKDIENVKYASKIDNIVELKSIKNIKNYIKNSQIVGFELDIVPYSTINYFRKLLEPAEIIDISPLIRETKAVKSRIEINFIKKAANLLNILCNTIGDFIKPGIEEYKIFAKAQEILIENGHQGYARMHGFNQEMFYGHILSGRESLVPGYLDAPTCGKGLYPSFPQGSSNRTIVNGDLVSVDVVGAYNGYYADQTRPFAVGEIKNIFKENFKKVLDIQEEVISLIKPGILWEDAYLKAIETAKKLKVDEYFMGYKSKVKFVGHGIGVEVDEFPFLSSGFKKEFVPNVVFALEPKIFIPNYGVVGIENTFLIKENGCEKLTTYPDIITSL